jgi:antitoxin ParD1/3/4
MNISLPEAMREYVETQVADGSYSSASEYFRALVREDQKRKSQERIEALLLEGLESGEPMEVTPQCFERKRRELRARHEKTAELR